MITFSSSTFSGSESSGIISATVIISGITLRDPNSAVLAIDDATSWHRYGL